MSTDNASKSVTIVPSLSSEQYGRIGTLDSGQNFGEPSPINAPSKTFVVEKPNNTGKERQVYSNSQHYVATVQKTQCDLRFASDSSSGTVSTNKDGSAYGIEERNQMPTSIPENPLNVTNDTSKNVSNASSSTNQILHQPSQILPQSLVSQDLSTTKATTFSHLHLKYSDELNYMLVELRKLEIKLQNAYSGSRKNAEGQGSKERRERLHAFISHVETKEKEIKLGAQQEKDNELYGTTPLNLLRRDESIEQLENHILNNLIPVKERLVKQLSAQGKLSRSSKASKSKEEVSSNENKVIHGHVQSQSQNQNQSQSQSQMVFKGDENYFPHQVSQPSHHNNFQKPSTFHIKEEKNVASQYGCHLHEGKASSLTKKLHGQVLGCDMVVKTMNSFREEVNSNVNTETFEGKVSENSGHLPSDHLQTTQRRPILYAGLAPGSDLKAVKSSLSAAAGSFTTLLCCSSFNTDSSNDFSFSQLSGTDEPPIEIITSTSGETNKQESQIGVASHPPSVQSNTSEMKLNADQPNQQFQNIVQNNSSIHSSYIHDPNQALKELHSIEHSTTDEKPMISLDDRSQVDPCKHLNQQSHFNVHNVSGIITNIDGNRVPEKSDKSELHASRTENPATMALQCNEISKIKVGEENNLLQKTKKQSEMKSPAKDQAVQDQAALNERRNRRILRRRRQRIRRNSRMKKSMEYLRTSNIFLFDADKKPEGKSGSVPETLTSMCQDNVMIKGENSVTTRQYEYMCSHCNEQYRGTCHFNSWWALKREICAKCGMNQVPRIDISLQMNAIKYHPALLSHIEDNNVDGGDADNIKSNERGDKMATTASTCSGFNTRSQYRNAYNGTTLHTCNTTFNPEDEINSEDEKALNDDDVSSIDSSDEDPCEEDFGKNYAGTRFTDEESAKILMLMEHASSCTGKHTSRAHKELCGSIKYMMLHVRDCSGVLVCCGIKCPFPWCRKVKHLLHHLITCTKNSSCRICNPQFNCSPAFSELVKSNILERQHRLNCWKHSPTAENVCSVGRKQTQCVKSETCGVTSPLVQSSNEKPSRKNSKSSSTPNAIRVPAVVVDNAKQAHSTLNQQNHQQPTQASLGTQQKDSNNIVSYENKMTNVTSMNTQLEQAEPQFKLTNNQILKSSVNVDRSMTFGKQKEQTSNTSGLSGLPNGLQQGILAKQPECKPNVNVISQISTKHNTQVSELNANVPVLHIQEKSHGVSVQHCHANVTKIMPPNPPVVKTNVSVVRIQQKSLGSNVQNCHTNFTKVTTPKPPVANTNVSVVEKQQKSLGSNVQNCRKTFTKETTPEPPASTANISVLQIHDKTLGVNVNNCHTTFAKVIASSPASSSTNVSVPQVQNVERNVQNCHTNFAKVTTQKPPASNANLSVLQIHDKTLVVNSNNCHTKFTKVSAPTPAPTTAKANVSVIQVQNVGVNVKNCHYTNFTKVTTPKPSSSNATNVSVLQIHDKSLGLNGNNCHKNFTKAASLKPPGANINVSVVQIQEKSLAVNVQNYQQNLSKATLPKSQPPAANTNMQVVQMQEKNLGVNVQANCHTYLKIRTTSKQLTQSNHISAEETVSTTGIKPRASIAKVEKKLALNTSGNFPDRALSNRNVTLSNQSIQSSACTTDLVKKAENGGSTSTATIANAGTIDEKTVVTSTEKLKDATDSSTALTLYTNASVNPSPKLVSSSMPIDEKMRWAQCPQYPNGANGSVSTNQKEQPIEHLDKKQKLMNGQKKGDTGLLNNATPDLTTSLT